MRRRLINLVAALSLLLCVASVALWAWSYFANVGLNVSAMGQVVHVVSARGGLYGAWFTGSSEGAHFQWVRQPSDDYGRMFPDGIKIAGMKYASSHYGRGDSFTSVRKVYVPYWAICVIVTSLW